MTTQKPDLTRVWANGAPPANVVDPDTTTPGKVNAGWQAEVPPFEHFNFLQKWFTQGLAHFNEQGIGVWDTDTTYPVDGLSKGSDGNIYVALQEQSGNDPVSDGGTNWELFVKPEQSIDVVTLEEFGGSADGSTDNIAALNAIRALPTNQIVKLLKDGVYFFAGNRPDLTGVRWYATDGARIKVDANPNIKEMQLLTDVTVENTIHDTVLIKHKNSHNDFMLAAGAAIKYRHVEKPLKILFTDPDVELVSISGVNSIGAFTGNNVTTYLSWTGFASDQEGALIPYEEGVLYEAAYRHIGTSTTSSSAFRGPTILTDSERVDFAVYPNQALAKKIVLNPGSTITDFPLPNGGSYSLSTDGAVYMGIRVVGQVVEFYINGTLFNKHELTGTPAKIGFLTSWFDSDKAQILNLTKTYQDLPVSSSNIKIAIVGDSISYGAWTSDPYDKIIQKTMEHAGIGNIETINYAVSSTATADWISGGSEDITTKDFTDVDYCLLMLGSNDVQGGVAGTTYETNMRSIITHLQSQDVIPVLGVFPMWTNAAISGVTGVTTQNYEKGGWHRQLTRFIAADLNLPLADVCAHFGNNISWLGDNIHPTEEGLIAVAAAFSEALIEDLGGNQAVKPTTKESTLLTVSGGWSSISGNQAPQYTIVDKIIMFSGPITGGTIGSTVSTVPVEIRPSFNRSFSVVCTDISNNLGSARITVTATGNVDVVDATVTPYVIFLDGVTYTL